MRPSEGFCLGAGAELAEIVQMLLLELDGRLSGTATGRASDSIEQQVESDGLLIFESREDGLTD